MDETPPLRIGGKFEEFLPLRLEARGPGELVVSLVFDERHVNAAGIVHGGFIASALDVALAGAAATDPVDDDRLFGITLSMTVNFIAPLGPGRVKCSGRVTGGGRRTRFVDAAMAPYPIEPPPGAAGGGPALCASATGTVRVVTLEP